MYSRSLGLIHFAHFFKLLCTCETCHKMSYIAMDNATIFRLTLANHMRIDGIKEKSRFHVLFFVLCFFTLKLLDIFLAAISDAFRSWWLSIVLTLLDLGRLVWSSFSSIYDFLESSTLQFFCLFVYSQEHQNPLLLVLTFLDRLVQILSLYGASSQQLPSICCKRGEREGFIS